MIVTDVEWVRDRRHRPVLQLRLDGHLTHIPSAQKLELTRRGLVQGVDVLASEWRRDPGAHPFIEWSVAPGPTLSDLMGCTDDPRVFALYEEMCAALRADRWRPGPRPPSV